MHLCLPDQEMEERAARMARMRAEAGNYTFDCSIMLGDSMEEVGFDTRQNSAVMREIARRAVLCFPCIGRLNIVRSWSALRIMPPDGTPIYDQSECFPGGFTANCHSGVTLAGAHARLLTPMIARGRLDPMLDPFSARRFDVRAAS